MRIIIEINQTPGGDIDHLVHAAAIGSGKFGFPFTNLDPDDWRHNPRHSAQDISDEVVRQLPRGNVILLHDSGGSQSASTVARAGFSGPLTPA